MRAYRPEDASQLARALLNITEKFVNRLNIRSNEDAVKFSEACSRKPKPVGGRRDPAGRLPQYPAGRGPEKESTQSLAMLGKMATEISRLEATLSQQRR